MKKRFLIVEGSQSCHCCFSHTIVDTTKPEMIGGEQYNGQFEAICECWSHEDARRIEAALNSYLK